MSERIWASKKVPGEVELAFGRAGSGSEPLVCVHGITAQYRAFNALATHLAPWFSIVALDLRGRGDSSKPESGYGLEAHARDVVRLLDWLGIERAPIVGHSMGAFVALRLALDYPDRVEALVFLDGGWPRIENQTEEMSESEKREAEAIQEGLRRSFSRIEMVFETPDDYLDFWFPDQGLTMDELPPELADFYFYDLAPVDGGYQPKVSLAAVTQDSPDVSSQAPTADEMRNVGCPVALVRAAEGFFPGTRPLISPEARAIMGEALDIRSDTLLEDANHYTMMWGENSLRAAEAIRSFLRSI